MIESNYECAPIKIFNVAIRHKQDIQDTNQTFET